MSYIRQKTIDGLEVGDIFTVERTFTEKDMLQFADISRDYNPVHFDERFAKVKNFSECICHGLLVACILTEIGGQIGWLASGMYFDFQKPVYYGDTIRCDFKITEIDDKGHAKAEVEFRNQDEIIVLTAVLTGIVPGEDDRKILKKCNVPHEDKRI